MTAVAVNTYTHSVTYVADNILKSFKDVIRLGGLDPTNFAEDWEDNMRALRAWLDSGDLQKVVLEVYHPRTDSLIIRWDVDVVYNWSSGDGSFWTDTEQLRYHILKAGVAPSDANYEIKMKTNIGRPDVRGWSRGRFRSTDGFSRQSLGSTVEHNGLGGEAAYWRKN